jgi:hypothetical protein
MHLAMNIGGYNKEVCFSSLAAKLITRNIFQKNINKTDINQKKSFDYSTNLNAAKLQTVH